jgi:long-chain acyl-CoA synthetase
VHWSYGQVLGAASDLARELEARRIGKGDRVLIWGENRTEWVTAFLGCMMRGVVAVPMDHVATSAFAMRVFEQVDASLIVCSRDHVDSLGQRDHLLLDRIVQSSNQSYNRPTIDLQASDVLEIVFTSGTTAEPKGVVITHGNVLSNLEPLEKEMNSYLKYEWTVHPIRFLNLLPLSHVFGQFLGIFLPPLMGATVIFQDALGPSDVVRTIKNERVSVLVAVPRMLQSLKEKVERDLEEAGQRENFQKELESLEGKHFLRRWWIFRRIHRQFGWKFWAFICGGAALDRVTEEFWGRLGFAVIQGYGLTETTSLISVNHPFKLGKGSVGKVLAGREMKLDDNGEILVRGGGIASAYWSGREMKPVAGEEGWYHTGDIGEIDAEGNLYFKGRKKDVIVTPAGMNVYPEDLEAALRRQPGVRDCIVIGLKSGGNAEPCAVLILDHEERAEPIVQKANESLADYQKMRASFVWPDHDFPRTSTGKPKANEIAQVVEQELAGAPAIETVSSPLAQMITRITGRVPSALPSNANLESDLNLSSLERVELMSALEERYQVDVSENSFSSANSVGDLERLLRGQAVPPVHYHYPRWAQHWPVTWVRLVAHYLLLRPAVFLLGWPKIVGRENLRDVRGPVLVISNHVADVDVGFILTALPSRFRHHLAAAAGGEAMEALRTPPPTRGFFGRVNDRIAWALGSALLNIFPLPRQAGFRQSFAYAGESVNHGYSILVFPEGRHTPTGEILPFRAGVGILANDLQIPIVPMRIDGLFELKKAQKNFALPHKITVRIGRPVMFAAGTDPEFIAGELRRIVAGL